MIDESRLERLIDAHFDLQLTPGERGELEAMLLSSSKARQRFLERAEWHGLLREYALRDGGGKVLCGMETPEPRRIRRLRGVWIGAAAAACLAVGLWLVPKRDRDAGLTDAPPVSSNTEVALLECAVGVEWDGASPEPGSAVSPGVLKFRSGTISLGFYSGARVVLEGPAAVELVSADLVRLDYGKLTAKVPPPAEGFTVVNNGLRVVDRGTQFGMNVSGNGGCEVHVFDGEVELQGEVPESASRELFEGDGVSIREGRATPITADRGSFADPVGMLEAAARETEVQRKKWTESSLEFRKAKGLRVYFDFEGIPASEGTLPNRAAGADRDSDGSIIGCDRLTGRWDSKTSLGFAKTSDRVRFRTQGTADSITLMASVRVDSLPLDHNSLLSMAPGSPGEVHWKIDRVGRLLVGLRAVATRDFKSWERLESPPVVGPADFGRWIRLTTVLDAGHGEIRHYVNGRRVATGPFQRKIPIQLGTANLGNLDPTWYDAHPVRNFNGRIDEFALFTRALSDEEVAAMP